MFASPFIPAFVVFSVLALSGNTGVVSAASAPESSGNAVQPGVSSLSVEYRRICEKTTRDSPEYRVAIEQALATYRERGGVDAFEQKLCHQLGLSYRKAEQYAKSTEILTANLSKGSDADLQATDMLLIARNARDSNDLAEAIRFMKELALRHPETSAGQTAQAELPKLTQQKRTLDIQESNTRNAGNERNQRGLLVGMSFVAIAILVTIFIRRQIRKRTC